MRLFSVFPAGFPVPLHLITTGPVAILVMGMGLSLGPANYIIHGGPNNTIGWIGEHVTQQSQSQSFPGIAIWMLYALQLQSRGCQGPCFLSGREDLSMVGKKEANLHREAERGPCKRWTERKSPGSFSPWCWTLACAFFPVNSNTTTHGHTSWFVFA